MPRRNLKSIVFEVFVIVVTISVVGHLTVNFWERYFLKNELAHMKESLRMLKNTLFNIGYAYDALHLDMKGLTEISERNPYLSPHLDCKEFKNALIRKRLRDMEAHAIIEANNVYASPLNKNSEGFNYISKASVKDKTPFENRDIDIVYYSNLKNKKDNQKSKHNHAHLPRKEKAHDIVTNYNIETVLKHPSNKVNVTTMTKNPPRNVGAGSLHI